MGKAKRRKQLHLGFGKTNYRISIKKSEKSGNFLIMINELIFDSVCEKQDAETIINLLKETLKDKPFPRKMDLIDLKKWSLENTTHFPTYEKFVLKGGKLEKMEMHISESIKIQMNLLKDFID